MKKLSFLVLLTGMASFNYAQMAMHADDLPATILKSVKRDFPEFKIVNENGKAATNFNEGDYPNDLGQSRNGTYNVQLHNKQVKIRATYAANGNLISKRENIKNKALPANIQKAIAVDFPKYKLMEDHMLLTEYGTKAPKVQYNVQLQDGNKNISALFDANGEMIKEHEKLVHNK